MNGRPVPLLAVALALFLASADVQAQRYHVHHYTEADGLPSVSVRGVTQDADGSMWFATRVGAASYDGLTWRTYGIDDGLIEIDLADVQVDAAGLVWSVAGAMPVQVAFYNGVGWTPLPGFGASRPRSAVTHFAVQSAGDVTWVAAGTERGNLHVGAYRGGEVEWRTLPFETRPAEPGILALEATGSYFAVGTSAGLFAVQLDDASLDLRRIASAGDGAVIGIERETATGNSWVVGHDWLGLLDGDRLQRVVERNAFNVIPDWTALVTQADRVGGLFFGNPSGVWYFHPQSGLEPIGRSNGLIAHGATALWLDREDNLWVPSLRGVSKIVSRRFASYDDEHGLLIDEVSAVLERRNGEIVLGHPGGLTFFTGEPRTMILGNEHRTRVMDMVEDSDGSIWIAAAFAGLLRLREGADVEPVPLGGEVTQASSVVLDDDGTLWVGTSSGVWRGKDGVFRRAGPATEVVRRLMRGPDGRILAGSPTRGLLRWSGQRFEPWARSDDPPANSVYAALATADGEVLVGTAAGLYRATDGRLVKVTAPAIDHPVYFIAVDARSRYWFGTDHGVVRWDGRRMDAFGVRDGLIGAETNRAAGVVDTHGRVWIGTNRGVSVYRPMFDEPRPEPPAVRLLELDVAGEHLSPDARHRLEFDHNSFVFRFRATSFVDESRVRFRYRLAGFDDDWVGPQQLPTWELRYTKVPPGAYRLHLQAVDAEGRRSAEAVSAPIVIRRPVWLRLWFLALVAAATVGLVVSAAAFVSQRRYSRRLEQEVRERTRELGGVQKLEALGLLAGGIAHDFNNLLTVVLGNLALSTGADDDTADERLARARAATEQAKRLTRQLLTFSAGGAPIRKAESVEQVIHESTSFALSGADVSFAIDLPDDLWVVEIDQDQMSQVIGNLLLNARQASPPGGGSIRVRGRNVTGAPALLPEGRYVVIEVEDNGIGIPLEHLDRVFDPYFTTKDGGSGLGLATAYSIVSRHDGRLTVESARGRGAVFRIYLPATDKPVAESRPVSSTVAPGACPSATAGVGRVLLMDDERAVREITAEILMEYGYTVDEAAEGREAVDRYREAAGRGTPYDVVIMDLTVPGGMGGKDAVRCLLEFDPAAIAIVVSGYSTDPVMANYDQHGFAACLGKPFAPEELARTLARVLTARNARASRRA